MSCCRAVKLFLPALILATTAFAAERETLNFNPDWRFIKADPAGAQAPTFDDHAWKAVSTPHTFNDEDTFDDWSILGHVGEQNQWSGRTWYRKTFNAPAAWQGEKVYLEFEAARQVAEVYLNGEKLGVCKTGFTPFGFDLTPYLKLGTANVLAVMVDNRFMKDPVGRRVDRPAPKQDLGVASPANPSLQTMLGEMEGGMPEEIADLRADQIPWNNPHWHPAHGGIYRNVRLHVTDPLHISLPLYSFLQTEGPYVYATDIGANAARVSVEIPVENDRAAGAKFDLRAEVFDADGKSVLKLQYNGAAVAAGAKDKFKLSGFLAHPRLWSPDSPNLYRVVCRLVAGNESIDATAVPLGIRDVRWDVASGLYINGRHVMLHGWGQKPTNEWPGLGAALPNWLHYYTLDLMKQAGGNFVRWGHAASGPAQIESADRLGIVILQPGADGEADTRGAAWKLRAITFRDDVIYFRNNPSIFIWEGGNQKVTREHAQELRSLFDRYDPHGGRVYAQRRADEITGEFMDVSVGTEGGHEVPRLPVVEGEYNREESPRRVWDNFSPPNFGYVEAKANANNSYNLNAEEFATHEVQHYVTKLLKNPKEPGHAGGANWIFSDSTSGGRVACEVARASGEVDGVRLPKEAYYVCAAMFRADPQVHIIGHWSYPANTKKDMFVASNADDVELFVNGKSLGHGQRSEQFLFTFKDVAFAPGEINVVASRDGKTIATHALHTVGAPVALKLTALTAPGGLRADGQDIALIDVEAVDANGERCPTFQQRADFETSGPAVWRGGYNSGKIKSTNNAFLDLECGINRVAVRATREAGTITVRAKSAGLKDASVTIAAVAFAAESGISAMPPVGASAFAAPKPVAIEAATTPAVNGPVTKPAAGGKFITNYNYTGPTANIVRIGTDAANGKTIYADRAYPFTELPAELIGADWLQIADADQRYNAVDLIELAVKGGTVVTIAHDDRVPAPSWLVKQFQPTDRALTINGKPMKLFTRRVEQDASLTFGPNSDGAPARANHYVVLVNAAK
jgi:beta-galactosidase